MEQQSDIRSDGHELEPLGHALAHVGCRQAEYPAIYSRFAELIDARAVEADLAPLRLVEDSLRKGRTLSVEAFEEW
jgi:hypothetical protein